MTGDELRDRIAAALAADGRMFLRYAHRLADDVMPVVREAIAAELDAAADDPGTEVGHRRWLHGLADGWRTPLHDRANRWRQP